MYLKLLINDFNKNKWSNAAILMFISLSVMVAVTVVILLSQLFTSIYSMYEVANPPHFLQLHKGEISRADLDKFNSDFKSLKYSQIIKMINIDGNEITISNEKGKKRSLADCRLDISFVKQNNRYDVLLDKYRNALSLNKGEIAVPIIIAKSFDIEVGDRLTLRNRNKIIEYRVSSYAYDGQMNSTLASSTRFLISDEDFKDLQKEPFEKEYMVEAWFSDSNLASAYQNAYEASSLNLPKNGQAVTYKMIFLLSALSDLMLSMIFLLMGIFLITISLICLRYAILADMGEDMKEIGVMKAIGIPGNNICNFYLNKIKIITFIGSGFGLLIALLGSIAIDKHLSDKFGNQRFGSINILFALLVTAILYIIIILFSKKIIKSLLKVSIVDLLVNEKGIIKKVRKIRRLRRSKMFSFNVLVSLHKLGSDYSIIFVLMLIISFLIMIPFRTVQTMENDEFANYMGSPVYDLLIDVEPGENLEIRNEQAHDILKNGWVNGDFKQVDSLRIVRLQCISFDGETVGIHTGLGKSAGTGLKYISGKAPNKDNEIALSYLSTNELKKSTGDKLKIKVAAQEKTFTISGVYQDITGGGRTAKSSNPFFTVPSEKYSYGIKLKRIKAEKAVADLRSRLGKGYSVENMKEFLGQTLGNVVVQIKRAGFVVLATGIILSSLIVALFIRLLITREAPALALKKSMGIPLPSIKKQELYPILISGGLGSLCGVALGELFGDVIISSLFIALRLGLKEITFVEVPIWQFFIVPLILMGVLALVGSTLLNMVKRIDVMRFVNEE